MAIQDYKVSEAYSGRDISSLSDRPNQDGMSASQLKARFDQLGKEVIPNYNDLIDFIETNLFSGGVTNDHTHNVDNLEDGTVNRNYTQTDKTKLDGIETNAEVNQNAFSNVKVGSTTIPSTTKTDTIELVAGLNITMTVDVATKKVFLSATGDLATEAVQSLIVDINNYYEALNVEDALQELGAVINGLLRSEAYFGFDSNQQTVTLNFQDGTSLNLGSELWYAQGKAVGYIASGDNVMLAGSQGDHYLVKKAVASELAANPQLYLGVATKGSANGEWVKITRWGLVNDVNTNGWAYGTKLYFDPTTLGFTTTLPSLPNARIEVGMVVRQHTTSGIILVLPYALNLYTNSEIDAMFNPSSSKTTPINADSVTIVDSADSNKLKKLTWSNIKTTLKTYFDTLYQSILVSGTNIKTINGNSVLGSGDIVIASSSDWNLINATLTYASSDSPTFVANTSIDLTSVISVGMKLKLTQTTVKYFIVTAITSTTITLYGGTDYTLANATITLPYFSSMKAPFGFPLNPDKWSIIATATSLQAISNPVLNQWYELTNGNISIPIGLWNVYYQIQIYAANATETNIRARSTLSTTNNSETIASFTRKTEVLGKAFSQTHYAMYSYLERVTKATYYLLIQAPIASYANLNNDAGSMPLIIKAVCAYL